VTLKRLLIKFPTLDYYLNFFHTVLVTLLLTGYEILQWVEDIVFELT